MLTYNISNIIEINNDGLVYQDNEGNKQVIDFNIYRKNWAKYVNESNEFIRQDGKPTFTEKASTCVGQRDWFDKKPYFEFFTKPNIRFQLVRKQNPFIKFLLRSKYFNMFYAIQKQINNNGWSTYDLG